MFDENHPPLLSLQQAALKIGKSEKTIRRWISNGKLQAEKHGTGGYLIKSEDVEALTKHVTKEWQEQSDLAHIRHQSTILEGQVQHLSILVETQQEKLKELQHQVKKLAAKKTPAKRKTADSVGAKTTKRKQDIDSWLR